MIGGRISAHLGLLRTANPQCLRPSEITELFEGVHPCTCCYEMAIDEFDSNLKKASPPQLVKITTRSDQLATSREHYDEGQKPSSAVPIYPCSILRDHLPDLTITWADAATSSSCRGHHMVSYS